MGNKKLEPRKFQNGGSAVKVIMKEDPKFELIKKYFESKLPKDYKLGFRPAEEGTIGDYSALIYDTANNLRDSGAIDDNVYHKIFDEYEYTNPYNFNDSEYYSDEKVNEITNELIDLMKKADSVKAGKLMPKKQDGGTLDQDRMDALTDAIKGKPEDAALDLISSWNDDGFINDEEYDYLFNYAVNSNGSARNAEVQASGSGELVEPGDSFDNEVNMERNPSGESEGENGKYVVKKGDSLWKIAKDHGMTVAELRSLNPKFANSNLIHPDDVLNVGTHSYSEYQYSDFDKAYAKAYREQQPTFEFNGKLYATPFKTAEQETPVKEEENNEPEEPIDESDTFMNELNSIAGETKNDESRSETRRRNRERREKRRQDRKERREERRSERKNRESRILERSRNRR
ncbi:MAG: LysM peptidoglycan-binding domain-containing protein [Paludibacteraceae bacterium]|nr:LysM peptidoglycan-binding domain-containing protein [Paludibacteraceae bacterium]